MRAFSLGFFRYAVDPGTTQRRSSTNPSSFAQEPDDALAFQETHAANISVSFLKVMQGHRYFGVGSACSSLVEAEIK